MTGLVLILLCAAADPPASSPASQDLSVDQAGYRVDAPKWATVRAGAGSDFRVLSRDGREVFRGTLGALRRDPDSGDDVRRADFTPLRAPGRYVVEVPGVGRSWGFEIQADPFSAVLQLALVGLTGQRCGAAVDLGPEHAGYHHAACHLHARWHPSSGRNGPAPSEHGWHDAGDYGRYVVNSSVATAALLWATELYGLPGPAAEARWNVDWLLSMQDADGGVWHKESSAQFPGFVMPEQDRSEIQIIGTGSEPFKSSCATADLAAVAAIAARVYAQDAPYAARNLAAARRAWSWLARYPDVTFRNPTGVHTGTYGDAHCDDELLWAAAELARTTHEGVYAKHFQEHFHLLLQSAGWEAPSTSQVTSLALWAHALGGGEQAEPIRRLTVAAARAAMQRTRRSGYGVSLRPQDYVWGSSALVAAQGWQLLMAFRFTGERAFADAAQEDLHYLLGRNTFSLSWLTGLGEHPYRHPHHRPSVADDQAEPWPGLLSGGPNAAREDPVMRAKLPAHLPPARMYLDDAGAYAANEPSVDGNGTLVFLLAGVAALR